LRRYLRVREVSCALRAALTRLRLICRLTGRLTASNTPTTNMMSSQSMRPPPPPPPLGALTVRLAFAPALFAPAGAVLNAAAAIEAV
jgi:hypothetical protein